MKITNRSREKNESIYRVKDESNLYALNGWHNIKNEHNRKKMYF